MVPFWVPNILRHLIFRVPQKGTIVLTTTHMVWGSELRVAGEGGEAFLQGGRQKVLQP